MISLITFVELRSMEGHKRPRNGTSGPNFVDDEERGRSSNSNNTLVGIRSEILKEEGGVPGDYCYADVPEVDGIRLKQQQQQQQQQQEHDSSKSFPDYGHMLGPVSTMSSEYRRLGQWNSESLSSDYPDKYKRLGGGVPEAGLDERRVRSRPEASVLSNLLGRRDDQTELHMNISARTLRPSGGKDRHSKVFTAKGPRDRRVRLSVSTAIQFYDVQDRLGYDQPSKAVEWLMKKAKNAIDELSQIPLPGIDRLTLPSSSYNTALGFGYSGSGALSASNESGGGHFSLERGGASFSSGSDMQLKGVIQQASLVSDQELENQSPELKVCSSSARDHQAVDESDAFPRQRPGEDLGADITMSVGEGSSTRTGREVGAHASIAPFNSGHISAHTAMPATSCQLQQQQRDWKNFLHPGSYSLYEDPCSSLAHTDHRHHHHHHHEQQQQHHQHRLELFQTPVGPAVQYQQQQQQQQHNHQQTSLITVQQTYLQQQEFLHNSSLLPFVTTASAQGNSTGSNAKPALDQFHSLKIASPAAITPTEKPGSVPSTALRFPSSFLASPLVSSSSSPNPELFVSPKLQQQQQQQEPHPSLQFDSSQAFPAKFQGLEEQLRRGSKRRD